MSEIRMKISKIRRIRMRRWQNQEVCYINSTMLLPCPFLDCRGVIGLNPIDLKQSSFAVVQYCPCGRGLNGGFVVLGELYGNRLKYMEGEKLIGIFDPNKTKWELWAT